MLEFRSVWMEGPETTGVLHDGFRHHRPSLLMSRRFSTSLRTSRLSCAKCFLSGRCRSTSCRCCVRGSCWSSRSCRCGCRSTSCFHCRTALRSTDGWKWCLPGDSCRPVQMKVRSGCRLGYSRCLSSRPTRRDGYAGWTKVRCSRCALRWVGVRWAYSFRGATLRTFIWTGRGRFAV